MTYTPLSSTEHGKIALFILLITPTLFFVGVLPILFLIAGFIMLRRTKDFSYIAMAIKGAEIYIWLAILICAGVVLLNAMTWERGPNSYGNYSRAEAMQIGAIIGAIAFGYKFALTRLLQAPLVAHKEWVEQNGVFASKAKNRESSEIDIIKGERLKSFSVADELIKWAKLKDDGHISEQEFNDARKKLLQRD